MSDKTKKSMENCNNVREDAKTRHYQFRQRSRKNTNHFMIREDRKTQGGKNWQMRHECRSRKS